MKVDLRKAYVTVKWEAMDFTLKRIGVPTNFICWVQVCIETARYSIIVDGSPYGYIEGKGVIQQGKPISPYLFVLVMELFVDLLKNEVLEGNFKLNYRCKDPMITHLSFVYDLIAFLNGDRHIVESLTRVLQEFKMCSSMEVNQQKTQAFCVGMDDIQIGEVANTAGFNIELLPVRYLGLPLITKRLSHADCLSLIDKFNAKVGS